MVFGGDCAGVLGAAARTLDVASAPSARAAALAIEGAGGGSSSSSGADASGDRWIPRAGVDPGALSDAFRGMERALRTAAIEMVFQALEVQQSRILRLLKAPAAAVLPAEATGHVMKATRVAVRSWGGVSLGASWHEVLQGTAKVLAERMRMTMMRGESAEASGIDGAEAVLELRGRGWALLKEWVAHRSRLPPSDGEAVGALAGTVRLG